MKTMFDKIMEYYKPIQEVEGTLISYGKLGDYWGFMFLYEDGYEHYDTELEAKNSFRKYLKRLLQEFENQPKEIILEEPPF
jgi:hypothetical protein